MTKRARVWAIVLSGGIVGFLAVLVLLPYGIRWAAERWMRQQGQVTVAIGDVDFNPFTGRLELANLEDPSRKGHLGVGVGAVGIDWLPLFRKRVRMEDIHLADVALDAVVHPDGTFVLGDLRFPPSAKPSSEPSPKTGSTEWGFGLGTVDLENVTVRYRDRWVEINVEVKTFHLDPLATWAPNRPAAFRIDMALNGGRIRAEGTVTPFADRAGIEVRGKIVGLHTVRLAKSLAASGIAGFDAVIDADAHLTMYALPSAREATVLWEGSLQVSGLKGQADAVIVDHATITWDGRVEMQKIADRETLEARGTAGLKDLRATLVGPGVTVETGALRWKGTVAYDGTPSAEGDLALGPWSVRTRRPDNQAVALEGGIVTGIRMSSLTNIEVESAVLRGLYLLEQTPSVAGAEDRGTHHLSVSTLSIGGLRVAPHRAEVEAVTLTDLRVQATREKGGEFDILSWVEALPSHSGSTPESSEPEGTPWSVRINEVTVKGMSRLGFRDESVSPPYEITAEPFELTAGPVDTGDPALDTRLTLKTKTEKYSSITLSAKGRPLAEPPSGTAEVTLEQIHLPQLTPYTQRHLGYRLKSGTLDLHTRAEVHDGQLTATNTVRLNKLELEPLDPQQKDELTQDLGLPVNTALSLLRDKNDDIELDIPVEGSLDDPEFGVGDAVGKALTKGLSKAVTTAAITYFAPAALLAAGPLGALFAAGKLISLASALRFDPVPFSPGSKALDPEAVVQVDQLGALLVDRPAVRLTLCGMATESDREAMVQLNLASRATKPPPPRGKTPVAPPPPPAIDKEVLLELAAARAEAVKDQLVTGNGVEPARLLVCSPELVTEPGAESSVLISL